MSKQERYDELQKQIDLWAQLYHKMLDKNSKSDYNL